MARKRRLGRKKKAPVRKAEQTDSVNLVTSDAPDLRRSSMIQAFSSLRDLVNFEPSRDDNNIPTEEFIYTSTSEDHSVLEVDSKVPIQNDSIKDGIVHESLQDFLNIEIKRENEDTCNENNNEFQSCDLQTIGGDQWKLETDHKIPKTESVETVPSSLSLEAVSSQVTQNINTSITNFICESIKHSGTVEIEVPQEILMTEGEIISMPCEDPSTGNVHVEVIAQHYSSLRELASVYQDADVARKRKRRRGLKRTVCDQCGHKSKTPGDLQKHRRYKHGTAEFRCPIQGCTFQTKYPNNIKHHLPKHTNIRPYQCPKCPWSFKRKTQLETHMKTHSDVRPHACDKCNFRAKRRWVLSMHISTVHSEERPFQCDVCGFRMKTRSDINKHKATHSKVRKCHCPVCSKAFKSVSSMYKHKSYMHGEQRMVTCAICQKKFKNKYALARHMMLHRGDKRCLCEVCSHQFSSRNNLEKHMVVHDETGRPFECPLCPFRGKEELHVRSHIGSMHGHLKLFICHVCHIRFKDIHKLKQHLLTEKHRSNMRFTLPPNDSEVKASVDETSLLQYSLPQVKVKEQPGDINETDTKYSSDMLIAIKQEPLSGEVESTPDVANTSQDNQMNLEYVKEEAV